MGGSAVGAVSARACALSGGEAGGHPGRRWSLQALPCAGSQVEAVQSPLGDVRWGCQSNLDTWVGPCFSLVVDTQSERLGPLSREGGTLPWKRGFGGEDGKPPLTSGGTTCVHVGLASPGIAFLLCSLCFWISPGRGRNQIA